MARIKYRVEKLEAQLTPAWEQGQGLASLLAEAALDPTPPWELGALEALADEELTGFQRLLFEALKAEPAKFEAESPTMSTD